MTATASDVLHEPHPGGAAARGVSDRDDAGLTGRTRAAIVLAPVAATLACVALIAVRQTRGFYDWLISENRPVEMATFLLALIAVRQGVRMATALLRQRASFAAGFYLLFALGMFFIGMEEISWGQQFFGWETPPQWGQTNKQNETTLHNLGPLQGKNDILRFAFGFGGLVGVALASLLPRMRVLFPHRVLLTWFLIIAAVSAAQLYVDAAPGGPLARPIAKFGRLAEVVELYISVAAVLYLWLNRRQFIKPAAVTSDAR